MARPAKRLLAHVLEGSFRARRHHSLLAGPLLPYPAFALLQQRYQQATSEPERRTIAVEVERLVAAVHAETRRRGQDEGPGRSLDAELAELGKPTSADHLGKFFARFYRHPKGPMIGQPFLLERWQQQFLREFHRRDRNGDRVYKSGLLGIPRGNGKTPLAAGLGLYELIIGRDGPEVYCAAGSKEQALIALEFARSFVEQGELAEWVRPGSILRCEARAGTMRVVSSDGRLQHGRAPSCAILDELWAFETAREEQTYTAFASALHKRPDAYQLAITTAGYDKHSLLGRIYDAALHWPDVTVSKNGCLTIAKDLENGQLAWWYGAPATVDIENQKVWRACNPASWIKLPHLRRQLHDPGLGENEFRRLHLNQWTLSRDAWLPAGCWQNLRTDQQIPEGADVYVGVDVGLVHDSTAVCWAHLLEDGRVLLDGHVWSAQEDAAAHTYVPGGKVRLEEIEQFIRELKSRYRIREVAYDPRFFQRSAEILERDSLILVEFLQASAPMADAYQAFYQAALEGRLAHTGDPVLAQHVEATAAIKGEHGWKVSKLKNSQRIDATVACVLAHARAQTNARKGSPSVYWMEW